MKLSTAVATASSDSEVATLSLTKFQPGSGRLSALRRAPLASPKSEPTNKWIALAIILVGPFLGVIDFFIANIGVPSIRVSLGASFSEIELVIAGYGLTYAVCLITGGRLGDIYGRKVTFIAGMAGFTLTSALCGLAPTAGWLIFWRLVQGCAAAAMFPQALSFIQVNFIGSSKRVAFSLYGAMIGFGSIVGQLLGGLLIHANLFELGWRPIFLINLPIGILTIIGASFVLEGIARSGGPETGSGRRGDPDGCPGTLFVSFHGGTGTRMASVGLGFSARIVSGLLGILDLRTPAIRQESLSFDRAAVVSRQRLYRRVSRDLYLLRRP